jgi:acetyl-CoA synthetase
MTQPGKSISTESLQQEGRTFPPPPHAVKRAHLNVASYHNLYERSVKDSDAFWLEQCNSLEWFKKPTGWLPS